MGQGPNGGNPHKVQVGEEWRLQTLRSPYMCPVLEADGVKFDPARHMSLTFDREHAQNGTLSDDCCYMDVQITAVDDDVVQCRTIGGDADGNLNSYAIFEVLNDDTVVRFYRK